MALFCCLLEIVNLSLKFRIDYGKIKILRSEEFHKVAGTPHVDIFNLTGGGRGGIFTLHGHFHLAWPFPPHVGRFHLAWTFSPCMRHFNLVGHSDLPWEIFTSHDHFHLVWGIFTLHHHFHPVDILTLHGVFSSFVGHFHLHLVWGIFTLHKAF